MDLVSDKKTIGSVVKAFDVIDLLASADYDMGVTEISGKLQTGVSGTYHLLATLTLLRIIEQDPETKKYRLGLRLWTIGERAKERNHLISYFRPYLKRIRDVTGETTNLTFLDGNEIIYVAQEESDKLVRMFAVLGARVPLYCSAAGKVLLAFQPHERREEILKQLSFRKFTDHTITTVEGLRHEITRILTSGYGCDDEEREAGVTCLAVPVLGIDGYAIAAISISGPTARLEGPLQARSVDYLLKLSGEISQGLGHKQDRTK